MVLARLFALTVALHASTVLAKRAPDFEVEDLDGNRYTLASLSGKLVVLNFWFKACPACGSERAELNRVVSRYRAAQDVVFLAPALDDASKLRPFLRGHPFRYAVVPEAEQLAEAFGVSSYPTHVIIGRDGRILRRWTGAVDTYYRLIEAIDAEMMRPAALAESPRTSAPPIGGSPVWEPILLVRPERPTRGATVRLFYSPQSLRHPAEAHVAWDVHGDASFSQGVAPMRTQGVLLSYELKLPEDATLVHLRVVSREDQRIVEHTLPVTGADGQPVRNAFVNLGACDTPLPIERELERYPGSPFALLARLQERPGVPGASAETARAELFTLLKTAEGNGLELLAVTVDALLLARDFEALRPVLDTLVLLDREAFLTRRALYRLVTEPDTERSREWPEGLVSWAWGLLAERDDVWSRRAASMSTGRQRDTAVAERSCARWRTAEPDNPFAQDCLARILEEQGRLQEALQARRAAIEAVSAGKLPLYRAGIWSRLAWEEEELWARHAELSIMARSQTMEPADQPQATQPVSVLENE